MKVNFDPETEIFTLQDDEDGVLIILTRKQLEALVKLYHQCYGSNNV